MAAKDDPNDRERGEHNSSLRKVICIHSLTFKPNEIDKISMHSATYTCQRIRQPSAPMLFLTPPTLHPQYAARRQAPCPPGRAAGVDGIGNVGRVCHASMSEDANFFLTIHLFAFGVPRADQTAVLESRFLRRVKPLEYPLQGMQR
jgi:hypothetical protein